MDPLSVLSPQAMALLNQHGLLQQLAQSQIMLETANAIELNEAEQNQVRHLLCQHLKLEDPAALEATVAAKNLDLQGLLEQAARPLKMKKDALDRFGHKVEQHFLTRKAGLDQVVYSLLRVKDADLANELYLMLAGNESNFADLAAQFSEGPERSTRGIVGAVPINQAHPILAERLRSSQPGELLAPIQVEGWNLVVRLESLKPANLDPTTELAMAQELQLQWIQQEAQRRIETLQQRAFSSAQLTE
jgi:parvulin-like peptidyl-prolyl isomerase